MSGEIIKDGSRLVVGRVLIVPDNETDSSIEGQLLPVAAASLTYSVPPPGFRSSV